MYKKVDRLPRTIEADILGRIVRNVGVLGQCGLCIWTEARRCSQSKRESLPSRPRDGHRALAQRVGLDSAPWAGNVRVGIDVSS